MRWLLGIVLLTSCYAPQPPQGAPCGPVDPCPSGQMCFSGFCAIEAPPGGDAPPEPDSFVEPGDAPIDTLPPVPPVMVFGERPDAIEDTWIDTFLHSDEPTNNFGNHPDLHLRESELDPVLIRIDVGAVPGHARVTAAKLHFRVTSASIAAGTAIDVFALNESWTEGTGDHSGGIANLTDRNPGVAWSAEGAKPPSRGATAITREIAGAVGEGDELVIELPEALVEGWVANPSANRGIALIVDAADFYCELGSSEFPNVELRPFLELALE